MKPASLAFALILAGSAALAQNPTTGGTPGPGGGAGRVHPDGKGPPGAPSTATAPPHSGDIRVSNEGEARRVIEAEGFTRVSGLKREADGSWAGRAMRGTANVAVRVDQRGKVSTE